MSKLRLLDLFSGIGGFSLGLERSGGFETVAFCEISAPCRHLLAHHWPEVPIYEDVKTLKGEGLGEIDAICGGFPCQDISLAGKGAGLAGERSGLWCEYARLIGEIRPRFVVVENVSALLVRGFGAVIGDLAALGYDAWWDCIPACAVGAPHRRDRLWIVAYARGQQHEGFGDALRRAVAKGLSEAAADAAGDGWLEGGEVGGGGIEGARPWSEHGLGHGGEALAYAARLQPGRSKQRPQRERVGEGSEPLAVGDAHDQWEPQSQRCISDEWGRPRNAGWWLSEPNVGRVANGVPARVDRLHGLGNAVVPQIPELIGRAIMEAVRTTAPDHFECRFCGFSARCWK